MGHRAFMIAGDRAEIVANDDLDFRHRAAAHQLPGGVQVAALCNEVSETQFLVEDGLVEFMIGGGAGIAFEGDFVRVPRGVVYAYRNAGDTAAKILVRSASPTPLRRALRVSFEFAA